MKPIKYAYVAIIILLAGLTSCVHKQTTQKGPMITPFERVMQEEKDPKRLASLHMVDQGKKELQNLRYERAAQEFAKAIEVDSQNPYAYFYFAEARAKIQRYAEAIDLYDQSANYFDREITWKSQALTMKGEIQEYMKDYPSAKRSFELALKVYPQNDRAKQGMLRLSKD